MKWKLFFIWILFFTFRSHAQDLVQQLNQNWQFRQSGKSNWYKAEVPGTVHTDLLANDLIPDPFYRNNEALVQWVEKETWEYKTVFDLPTGFNEHKRVMIEFDGLDTYAEVLLNGKKIIEANNMFRQWNASIKTLLKKNGNVLMVRFFPASVIASKLKRQQRLPYPDNERVFVRKAQYQFGWDWGPRLVTCGIWKQARIVAYNDQHESTVSVAAKNNITLVRQKDSIGESFYFMVNGHPVFVKGANWIPLDNFLPQGKKEERYRQLIIAAREANINMLRVWGGGIYEDDIFYSLCDEYGIMVWQDFMFAGALYPADPAFVKNIEEEVRYQVKRLRSHTCIAIWCGNNEIEEAWFNWGWQKQLHYSVADSQKLWNNYRQVFHHLIPQILKELDPGRPYWPSSPSLGWGRDSAYKKGDVHYWGVWWGKEPVEKYREKTGRFNSEYGMQGMPDMNSIREFTQPTDWDTSSVVMKTHQKHSFGWENIGYYIRQKFRSPKTFEDLVYVSQLMQADAIKIAIEAHRSNAPVTMGTLFWQWNDCWPVTSWSAIDYYGRKKAVYYEVKRKFEPVMLSITDTDSTKLKLTLISEVDSSMFVTIESQLFDLSGNKRGEAIMPAEYLIRNGRLEIDFSNEILPQKDLENSYRLFIVKQNNVEIARELYFFVPPSRLHLQPCKINFELKGNTIELLSDKFAYGLYIEMPDGAEPEDNFFHLEPGVKKSVKYSGSISIEDIRNQIKIKSLVDTY